MCYRNKGSGHRCLYGVFRVNRDPERYCPFYFEGPKACNTALSHAWQQPKRYGFDGDAPHTPTTPVPTSRVIEPASLATNDTITKARPGHSYTRRRGRPQAKQIQEHTSRCRQLGKVPGSLKRGRGAAGAVR